MRWSTRKWHARISRRKHAKREWHLWFAWFPVRLNANNTHAFEFRWLEKVARKHEKYNYDNYGKYPDYNYGKYIYSDPSAILVEKVRKFCENEQL